MNKQSIIDQALQQINADFGSVAPTSTEPEAVFSERYTKYKGEPYDWLKTLPEPVADTKIVSFSRVSRSLKFQGTRLNRTPQKPIPDGVDGDAYVQGYVDECGLCAEAYNSNGEVIRKYTTRSETLNFL